MRSMAEKALRVGAVGGPAVLAGALAVTQNAHAPLWRDESATSLFGSLSVGDLLAATSHVDAVLAPYYLLMHLLSPVLGLGTGMRVVSMVAFVLTSAAVGLLALRWWGKVAAVVAGSAIALNGDLVANAANARPYTLSVLFLTIAIIAADRAIDTGRWLAWTAYAAAAAGAVALHLFAVIPVGTILVLVLRRPRRMTMTWIGMTLPAVIVAVALLAIGQAHRGQLTWLAHPGPRDAIQTLARTIGLSMDRAVAVDAIMLAVFSATAALSIFAAHQTVKNRVPPGAVRSRAFAATLTIAPPLVLYAISWAVTPVFAGKYFVWAAIGSALVIGGAAAFIPRPLSGAGTTAAVLATALVVLPGAVTLVRTLGHNEAVGDIPGIVDSLEGRAQVGDVFILSQPYAFGGVAYGFADSAGDDDHRDEVRQSAVTGTQPILDVRTITSVDPLRTEPMRTQRRASITTWVMSIFPLTADQLDTVDPDIASCLRGLDFDSPVERFGAVRLFLLRCDAPAGSAGG